MDTVKSQVYSYMKFIYIAIQKKHINFIQNPSRIIPKSVWYIYMHDSGCHFFNMNFILMILQCACSNGMEELEVIAPLSSL